MALNPSSSSNLEQLALKGLSYYCVQQRMTLSDLEWPFHASRAISAVVELANRYFECLL